MESAEKVGDYPVLAMDFYGSSALLPANSAQVHRLLERFYPAALEKPDDINCSLIAVHNPDGQSIYGRNFDWYRTVPVILRVHRWAHRYASISIVDGSYLGVTGTLSLMDRINLSGAYISPFDGMNEKGLFISIAMVKRQKVPQDPNKETITSVQMVRRILNQAATVDEAVSICNQYNIDFFPGPHLHFLIADASGDGAVVEFTPDGVRLFRQRDRIFATNFVMNPQEAATFAGKCWRYDRISKALPEDDSNTVETPRKMMHLLENVKQNLNKGRTEWSAVYETDGNLTVCFGMDYSNSYHFKLEK